MKKTQILSFIIAFAVIASGCDDQCKRAKAIKSRVLKLDSLLTSCVEQRECDSKTQAALNSLLGKLRGDALYLEAMEEKTEGTRVSSVSHLHSIFMLSTHFDFARVDLVSVIEHASSTDPNHKLLDKMSALDTIRTSLADKGEFLLAVACGLDETSVAVADGGAPKSATIRVGKSFHSGNALFQTAQ